MASRKDSKGRVLKTGESQRKDGTYMYRYTDIRGKRQSIYASDLKELRGKEGEIQKNIIRGVDVASNRKPLIDLVNKYLDCKGNIKPQTMDEYRNRIHNIENESLMHTPICDISMSDAKLFMIYLHNNGRKKGTVEGIYTILKGACKLACNDDIIYKNPFDFPLSDCIANDATRRIALTQDQQCNLLDFVKHDYYLRKDYNVIVALLETGMRVSEFCGLTTFDIDFNQNYIYVDHQLVSKTKETHRIGPPKSASGVRYIPMTRNARESMLNLVTASSGYPNLCIDGYSGFIARNRNGSIKTKMDVQRYLKRVLDKYNATYPNETIPALSPHILRHTFCTNMANAGMNPKGLQYIMGHSNLSITMNCYAHTNHETAAIQMFDALQGRPTSIPSLISGTTSEMNLHQKIHQFAANL